MTEKNSKLLGELGGTIKVHILFAQTNHIIVFCDDKVLTPDRSQLIYNHSPDGFSVGYHGSGCAQLALALLLEATNDETLSARFHQEFKNDFVSKWKQTEDNDDIHTTISVNEWLNEQLKKQTFQHIGFPMFLADSKGYYKLLSKSEYVHINSFNTAPFRIAHNNYGEEVSPLFIRYFKTFVCGTDDEKNLEELPELDFYYALMKEVNEYLSLFPESYFTGYWITKDERFQIKHKESTEAL